VDLPFAHLMVTDVSETVPVLFPEAPVLPLQPLTLVLVKPVFVFADPDNVAQVIPLATAPAGPAARPVNPANGARTAAAAIEPRTIPFFITDSILL
jgi:hypothetical protein